MIGVCGLSDLRQGLLHLVRYGFRSCGVGGGGGEGDITKDSKEKGVWF